MASNSQDKSHHAPESAKTKKARDKLKKQIEETQRKVTLQALERKSVEIHRWIARHAHQRVVLRNKAISLFDENQNTAKLSERVTKLAETLTSPHLELDKDLT